MRLPREEDDMEREREEGGSKDEIFKYNKPNHSKYDSMLTL